MTDKYAPQKRYHAKHRAKVYTLACFSPSEQDIIVKLESMPNKSGYIKALIRADIAKGKTLST